VVVPEVNEMAQRRSKRFKEASEQVDLRRTYGVEEGIALVQQTATAGFDETVEVAVRLGVDSGKGDQAVRGTVVLPHGTGKVPRVVVFAEGEAVRQAEGAGADRVGGEDLVEEIQQGWDEFDVLVAQPQMMRVVGRLGKMLGPRMPNKKAGTIIDDVAAAVSALKSGRVEFKMDRGAVLHIPIGKVAFSPEQLRENLQVLIDAVVSARPAAASGRYIVSITLSSTMGPGVKLDVTAAIAKAA
jgi:large subunit ribosomal protein L1